MTLEEIERLAARCVEAGIAEIELTQAGFSLRLRLEIAGAEAPRAAAAAAQVETTVKGVRAPGVGVFRIDHPATGRPVAEPGQRVGKGETVGLLQVGPCLKAVVAPAGGVLGPALVEDGTVVGYGVPLYDLK